MDEKKTKKDIRKEKINNIKSFLSDKKNKALVKLGLWFIFFILVIVYIKFLEYKKSNYVSNKPVVDELPITITDANKVLSNSTNYEFSFEYHITSDVDNIYTIKGQRYYNKYLINYNDLNYYYDNELYLLNENGKELIDNNDIINGLQIFDASKVYKYLLNSEYEYKQENADGIITIRSKLPLSKFGDIIGENIVDESFITIESVQKDDTLIGINIDLSNYYKMKDTNCLLYKVNIIYSNYGNVKNFNIN